MVSMCTFINPYESLCITRPLPTPLYRYTEYRTYTGTSFTRVFADQGFRRIYNVAFRNPVDSTIVFRNPVDSTIVCVCVCVVLVYKKTGRFYNFACQNPVDSTISFRNPVDNPVDIFEIPGVENPGVRSSGC